MIHRHLAAAILFLAAAAPSHALFDPGNVGLPTGNPGIFDPDDPNPPLPPPLPELPPIGIRGSGNTWIEFDVRPPLGRTSQLFRQAPGGPWAPFRSVTPGVESVIRDEGLGVGKGYCYRIVITGGTQPEETHTRCEITDWRVGFEGLSITPVESARVLELFDWRDTQQLAEGTPDSPALYHMNLLIEGGDPLAEQGYRSMGLHVQPSPIFSEEIDAGNDSSAVARIDGLPAGRWFFAVVPGRVYNEIRARMLDQISRGEAPGIRSLVFRRVPVAEALPVGVSRHALDYVYLGQQGFVFNAFQQCSISGGVRVCTIRQELLGWIARKVIHWVAELGDTVVEGVRTAIGRIARLIKGEVRLDIDFRLLNTDPGFGSSELMRSGWSGEELKLADVKIEVRQGLAGFYDNTDANGHVRLTVAKNSDTRICIQVENDTAEVTEYLLEKTVCVKNIGELSADRSEVVDVRHDYVNALVAMTDARRYAKVVGGFTMPKITVLVGSQADELAVAGRSFTPCMGRAPSLLGLETELLGLLGPVWLAAGAAAEFMFSVDMVLVPGDDASRGVAVHEYGHAMMCELMMRQGLDAFEIAWTDVIIGTASQAADNQASYLAEGWADFVTAQVVGGTNYFAATGAVDSESVNYCPAGTSCLEENFVEGDTFRVQVRRVASLLQDAFDGHGADLGPNDASHWQTAPEPFVHHGASDSDFGDEAIALAGGGLLKLFQHWDDRGTLLREDNFFGGLADLAKEDGYADGDVCTLFSLHESGASCPDFVARRPWLGWLDGTSGMLTGDLLQAFSAAPAPAPSGGGAAPIRTPQLLTAIAHFAPLQGSEPTEPTPTEPPADEPCVACAPPVVLEGVQKVQVARLGKSERDTAFAFRLGQGTFEGIDPLGQLYQGAWDARNAKGSKLRLHVGPELTGALEELLADSAFELGVDPESLRLEGPAKIELRLAQGGLVGKISLAFSVEVEGKLRRGTYVAKLRGASAQL